jgi:hypothetical protein
MRNGAINLKIKSIISSNISAVTVDSVLCTFIVLYEIIFGIIRERGWRAETRLRGRSALGSEAARELDHN